MEAEARSLVILRSLLGSEMMAAGFPIGSA